MRRWLFGSGSPEPMRLADGIATRLSRALRARDYIQVRLRSRDFEATWDEVLLFFDAVLTQLMGALDKPARLLHAVYVMERPIVRRGPTDAGRDGLRNSRRPIRGWGNSFSRARRSPTRSIWSPRCGTTSTRRPCPTRLHMLATVQVSGSGGPVLSRCRSTASRNARRARRAARGIGRVGNQRPAGRSDHRAGRWSVRREGHPRDDSGDRTRPRHRGPPTPQGSDARRSLSLGASARRTRSRPVALRP